MDQPEGCVELFIKSDQSEFLGLSGGQKKNEGNNNSVLAGHPSLNPA